MRVAAKRRQAGWVLAAQRLEGTERSLRLDSGGWVDVVRVGRGDPLVLVPGLAGGWRLVAPLALRLSGRFEVTICGLRGDRYPADGPAPRDLADHAHDLAEVMGRLRMERPSVMGISFGGAIALELACEQPQKVGGLILHGAGARFRTTLASTVARRVLERFPIPNDNRFVNQFFNILHGGAPVSDSMAAFVVDRCWETDQSVMARRLAMLENYDVADRLWRIDAPTLVVAGLRDVVAPPGAQKALADAIPGARFETLEGAGHVGFLSHRRDLALAAARHLRQVKHQAC